MKKQYFAPKSINVELDPKSALMQTDGQSINGAQDDFLFDD